MKKHTTSRALTLSLLLACGLSGLSYRLIQLQAVENGDYVRKARRSHSSTQKLLAKRGTIVDTNGEVIAQSIISKSLFINKQHLREPRTVAKGIACKQLTQHQKWHEWDSKERSKKIFRRACKLLNKKTDPTWIVNEHLQYAADNIAPMLGMTPQELIRKINLNNKPSYKAILKNIDPALASKLQTIIRKKNIKGFQFEENMRRQYHSPELATHVRGYENWQGTGRSGVEKAANEYLAGMDGSITEMRSPSGSIMPHHKGSIVRPINGHTVHLTIDMGIQAIVEEELDRVFKDVDAVRGSIIVMNPHTGDILGIASRPHFNLNLRKNVVKHGFNHALQAQYEPGSTFKTITAAAALDKSLVGIESSIFCHNGYYRSADRKIWVRDDHPKTRLKVWEILKKSNNIGSYMLAKQTGYEDFMSYVKNFGFGQKTKLSVGYENQGNIRDNGNPFDFSRKAYGYTLTVTPLQIANAYCVFANGGKLMQPNIIKKIDNEFGDIIAENRPTELRRVIKESTAKNIRYALSKVIEKGGTATRANVPNYTEGGKTGTAYLWDAQLKKYNNKKKVCSFVGMLPINHPKFVCAVVIEQPRAKKNYNFGGGTVAAPAWKATMERVAAYAKLDPDDAQTTPNQLTLIHQR